jgi:enoyl-CoA hydratase
MQGVRCRIEEGVAVVTLDRPPVNAITRPMLAELTRIFDALHTTPGARVAILTGAGDRAFCAGADIHEMSEASDWSPEDHGRSMRSALESIYECAIPVIAAINGPALGGGLALAASCDYAIASERARFGLPEIDFGALGGARHARQLFPMSFVRRMQYTGESLCADEAYRLGAVVRVVHHESLGVEAHSDAARLAAKMPMGLRLAKESLNAVEWMDVRSGYRFEQTRTDLLCRTDDAAEARAARREDRAPRFQGS